jgi:hypothetical protein
VNVTLPAFTVPAVLLTVALRVTLCAVALKLAEAFAATVVVAAFPTVNVCVVSLLAAKPLAPPYAAKIVYAPAAVFAGSVYEAVAAPLETGPLTAVPTTVLPSNTVNVTEPAFTVPAVVLTVALRVTLCALKLKVAEAFAATVVVAALPTVNV